MELRQGAPDLCSLKLLNAESLSADVVAGFPTGLTLLKAWEAGTGPISGKPPQLSTFTNLQDLQLHACNPSLLPPSLTSLQAPVDITHTTTALHLTRLTHLQYLHLWEGDTEG